MTILETFEKFKNYQYSLGHTDKTIQSYTLQLRPFINFMNNCDINLINYNDYENYIVYLRTTNIKSVSINSYARALKAFIHFCNDNHFIEENIYSQIKLPRYHKKAISILSDEQIDSILNYFQPYSFIGARNNLILTLFLDAGLRLNEVINLSFFDFDTKRRLIKINGKGQKQRYVPLTDNILSKFNHYMTYFENKFPPLAHIFVSVNNMPINQECIKSFFRRMRADLDIPNLHPHLLRHTFATLFLMNGGDPLSLQLILGHTTLTMTQKYVHFVAEIRLVEQMKFSPLSMKKKP